MRPRPPGAGRGRPRVPRLLAACSLAIAASLPGCGLLPGGPDPGPFEPPAVELSSLPDPLRKEALAAVEAARARPRDAEAVGRLGMHFYAYELSHAAAACFERAALLEPSSLKWRYDLGLALKRAGETSRAAEAMESAVAADPAYAPALIELGDLLIETDPGRAADLYHRAVEADPGSARAQEAMGRAARISGKREEALRRFLRAAELAPGYADAHYGAAMILVSLGRKGEAEAHLAKHAAGGDAPLDGDPLRAELQRLAENDTFTLQKTAERLQGAGDLAGAERLLRRAVETDVSRSTARKALGVNLGLQGRYDEAAEELRRALEANPGDAEAIANLAQATAGMGRDDEAEEIFRRAVAEHPGQALVRFYRAQHLERLGRRAEAIAEMREGLRLQPASGENHYLLGIWLANDGDLPGSAASLRKAASLLPGHAGARVTLGKILSLANDPEGARAAYEEAVRIAPALPAAWDALARDSLSRGRAAEAVEEARRACEAGGWKDPAHVETLAAAYAAAGRPADAASLRARMPPRQAGGR